jgi:pimeloyl-ACP methyl ester carboxylesterase
MAGLVILSPNFAPKDWRGSLLLWPWGDHIAQLANHGSRYREWKAENALQAARWTPRQPVESLQEMMSLVHYVDGLDFSQIHVPLLCLYTDADRTVSVDQIKRRFRDFGSPNKQLVAIPDARHHVMAGDAFSPETNQPIAERIVAFAREVTR